MSDPFENEFGIGSIGGGLEEGGGLGESESRLSKTEEVLISIANQLSVMEGSFEKMTQGAESLQPVAKEMAKSKFVKSSKSMKDMFKSMTGALGSVSPMMLFMKTLKPLMDLFKPFQVILDIISSLLKVLVGEALKPMFKALQPLFDALIALMPVFAEIGAQVGELLASFLGPFVDILLELMPAIAPLIKAIVDIIFIAIQPLMDIFLALMPIVKPIIELITNLIVMAMEPLKAIFDAIMPVLLPIIEIIIDLLGKALKPMMIIFDALMPILMPLIELALIPLQLILMILEPLLSALGPVFEIIAEVLKPLKPVLGFVAMALGLVGEAFKFFINIIIGVINFIMNALTLGLWKDIKLFGAGKRGMPTGGAKGEKPVGDTGSFMAGGEQSQGPPIPGMAGGGIALSHGIYELAEGGRPEMVVGVDKWEKAVSAQNAMLGLVHDELMIANAYNRDIAATKEWKRAFG